MPELASWDNFYVIAGSAAGGLIGLQFIVMTLVAERPSNRSAEAGAAFATPTILHFSAVLLLSALSRAPWPEVSFFAAVCGVIGVLGLIYAVIVARRMRTQSAYRPVFEDWVFHAALPFVAYAILTAAPFVTPAFSREALFGVGGAALILLFTGIHNSWDAVAYHVFVTKVKAEAGQRREEPSQQ